MSFYWWFFFLFLPLLLLISLVSVWFLVVYKFFKPRFQASAHKRRQRGRILHPVANNPVIYSVPSQVYVQPVHNHFPNTRHVAPSTLVVEQRLNQHYATQQHQQPPPYYTTDTSQQQRY